jgi:signal transduction histidine kinase
MLELTATQQPEDDARLRLEAVGEKLVGLLHDVSGPLAAISGFAELMADETDAAVRQDMCDEILRSVQRIVTLREQTLAFSRGARSNLKRRVHLYAFCRDIARTVERELKGSPVRFEVVVGYGGPAELDEQQILRAVQNLTRNAREAMAGGKGSHFDVAIERLDRELVLSFSDDGPGVPEKVRARLFERFATYGKADGNGLGLYFVRQTAEAHGGVARYFSVPGHGARFELRLPFSDAT